VKDPHLITSAYKTVETFAGIVKKPLTLKNGKVARSNGNEISVPFNDSRFYLLVERQLSHILFRSDARARARFVKDFIAGIEKLSDKYGIAESDRASVQSVIERIIDILESHRIESLWGMIYPGSYARSRLYLQTDAARLLSRAHDSFFDFLMCLDAALEVPAGPLDRFRSLFLSALSRVERRGFTATLVLARWLVSQLVDEILRRDRDGYRVVPNGDGGEPTKGRADAPPNDKAPPTEPEELPEPVKASARERMMALQAMAHEFGKFDTKLEQRYNDYVPGMENADFFAQSRTAASTALEINLRDVGKIEEALEASERQMESFLDSIQKQLTVPSPDDWLKKETYCHLIFVDVRPDDFDAQPLSFTDLTPLDQLHVQRLRTKFIRVIGRRSSRLEDTGSEIDLQAYLEAKATGLPVSYFKQEIRGRGFRALLLIDRSLSMRGSRIEQAERASRMLMDALDFPFVELSVWGFQSLEDGEVTLTRFSPLLETFHTSKSPVDGGTPLHIALKVAVRELSEGSEAKHLILLTDGAPMYAGANHRLVAETQLRLFVREQVQTARRQGIHVTSLLVGDRAEDGGVQFDVSRRDLQFMFGSERYWKCIDAHRLGEGLVQAVTDSFLSYLSR
jgi:von Willebrand factor type A domain